MRKLFYISFLCVLTTFTFCSKNETVSELEQKNTDLKKKEIKDFLVSKGIAPENIHFTDTLTKENALTFSSIKEFEAFLEKNQIEISYEDKSSKFKRDVTYSYGDFYDRGNTVYFSGSKELYRVIGLKLNLTVSGSYIKSPVSYEISDSKLTSYITGFVVGASYEHKNGGVYYDLLSNNTLRFTVHGVLSHRLFFGDVGTVYSSPIDFSGTINDMSAQFD